MNIQTKGFQVELFGNIRINENIELRFGATVTSSRIFNPKRDTTSLDPFYDLKQNYRIYFRVSLNDYIRNTYFQLSIKF